MKTPEIIALRKKEAGEKKQLRAAKYKVRSKYDERTEMYMSCIWDLNLSPNNKKTRADWTREYLQCVRNLVDQSFHRLCGIEEEYSVIEKAHEVLFFVECYCEKTEFKDYLIKNLLRSIVDVGECMCYYLDYCHAYARYLKLKNEPDIWHFDHENAVSYLDNLTELSEILDAFARFFEV
jgi:hypothetical protein